MDSTFGQRRALIFCDQGLVEPEIESGGRAFAKSALEASFAAEARQFLGSRLRNDRPFHLDLTLLNLASSLQNKGAGLFLQPPPEALKR